MSAKLAVVPPRDDVSAEFSQLFNYFHQLEEFEHTVLELLPLATDDQVNQTRERARAMGSTGWRLVCACDAVILTRKPAKPGIVDIQKTGRLAAAKERAREAGCDSSTVRRNAQIYNTFFKSNLVLNVQQELLDDKGYFEAALRAPDAKKAIKVFVKEKEANPNFSVRDAFRLAKTLKESRTKINIPNAADYLDPNFKSFLLEFENSLLSFKNRCPRVEFVPRLETMIRITRYERSRTPQSDYEAVRKQVDEGACTVEEIAEEVYLSIPEIKKLIGLILEKEPETYETRPIGANTDQARGSRAQGIFPKNAPSGDDFEMPHGHRYEPTVEYDDD